jgi:hypothetical protein
VVTTRAVLVPAPERAGTAPAKAGFEPSLASVPFARRLRSSLELFRNPYRDSIANERVAETETDETDAKLEEWGAERYLEEIPPGYPDWNVWWHQRLSGK